MNSRNGHGWTVVAVLGFIVASGLAVGVGWPMIRGPAVARAPAPVVEMTHVSSLALAEEAMLRGDWRAAEEAFEQASAQDPGSVAVEIGWARALAFQYRYADAVGHARRAVELAPRGAPAHAVLAQALNWAGDVGLAAASARRSIDLDPELAEGYAFLAECLADQYQLAGARQQIERALALDPTGVEPHRVNAYLLETETRYPEAAAAYQAAIASAPRYAHLHFALGNVYRTLGETENATMSYRTAANLVPTDARPLVGLGLLRVADDDYSAAIPYFEQAAELDPSYATSHGQLGAAYYRAGDVARAREPLERAVQLERNALPLSSYRHVLGWVYLRSGSLDEAERAFSEALALNPALDGAREGLRAVRTTRDR